MRALKRSGRDGRSGGRGRLRFGIVRGAATGAGLRGRGGAPRGAPSHQPGDGRSR